MKDEAILREYNTLLLALEGFSRKIGAMTTKEKEREYGFHIFSEKGKKYFSVKYKDPETEEWITTKTSTETDNEEAAVAYAIENKERIIKEYKEKKARRQTKNNSEEFFAFLKKYYQDDSTYLERDTAANKNALPYEARKKANGFINNYLIPFFREKKINDISEVDNIVYSDLKIYLKNKQLKTKSINNILSVFNRILHYSLRSKKISALPYTPGEGRIRLSAEEKTNPNKPKALPADYFKGVFTTTLCLKGGRENTDLSYHLSLLGLSTGARDSELGRLKVSDIHYSREGGFYYAKILNHKIERFTKNGEEYRKIPLHPFVVERLTEYIKNKNLQKNDYLLGVPKLSPNTKKIDGYLHQSKAHNALIFFLRQIKFKENLAKGEIDFFTLFNNTLLEEEAKNNHYSFNSFRHTFTTLLELNAVPTDAKLYFTGHKSPNPILDNYTQINQLNNKFFYDNYGKRVISTLEKFVFISEKEAKEKEDIIEGFLEAQKGDPLFPNRPDLTPQDYKLSARALFPYHIMADTQKKTKTEAPIEDAIFTIVD
jgi:integrase